MFNLYLSKQKVFFSVVVLHDRVKPQAMYEEKCYVLLCCKIVGYIIIKRSEKIIEVLRIVNKLTTNDMSFKVMTYLRYIND